MTQQPTQSAAKPAAAAEIHFTPAQQAAITDNGGNLLVSAAAGSGKTRVLVERVVRKIVGTDGGRPISADRLLIMTFTNAAAAKLRADIAARLAQEVHAHPEDVRLRIQQMRLQRASIGTVDAFCLHFVQEHFTQLDVPPDFELGGDAEISRIAQETLTAVLEDAYKDPDFCAFADLYGRGRSDATAGEAVLSLYKFVRTLPKPRVALEEFCAGWAEPNPPEQTVWGKALLKTAEERMAAAFSLTDTALACAATDAAVMKGYGDALQQDREFVASVLDKLKGGNWDEVLTLLQGQGGWAKLGSVRGKPPAAAQAKALRDCVKKLVGSLQEQLLLCTAEEYEDDRRRALPLLRALCRAVQEFDTRSFAARLEEKLLTYADLAHLTLDLLLDDDNRKTQLCNSVAARYDAVMVDEYQDTNALQDAIYFALSSDGKNLFFVGDIKQSIYRFRQAEPAVFMEKQAAWKAAPQPAGESATIALDANFRSAPNVIGSINALFETIFSQELGGTEYGDGQRLVVGDHNPLLPGVCELDLMDGIDREGEAAAIAQRIAQMRADGFSVRDHGQLRSCNWGDFCILLRGRADFATYEAALRKLDIPVYADTATDLLGRPHVLPFAALLQVLDNPAQDVELAAVMLSPMFGLTPDDLVRLRAGQKNGSLYSAMLTSDLPAIVAFRDTLGQLQELAATLPVDALIETLLARTGYLAAVGAMRDGAACRSDLREFATWAGTAGRAGLSALTRAIRAAAADEGVPANGGGQSRPGCVSIMTVHRSKGLEFPVVFVADASHQFNLQDAAKPLLYHRVLGVGLQLRAGDRPARYRTLPYAAIAQTLRRETASEEMRILYVALTRAQDALFITVHAPRGAKSALETPALYASARATGATVLQGCISWAAWLLTAALCCDGSDALWAAVEKLPPGGRKAAPLQVRVVAAEDKAAEEAAAEEAAPPVADEALYQTLLDNFAWQYPEAALQDIPAKVSVSALVHGAKQTSLQRPAFLQKNGLTGAERGSAIHKFLQGLPFDAPTLDLEQEKQRQTELHLLEPALAERLDLAVVQRFLDSAAWRRIRAAKQTMREEPFITALPAREVASAAAGCTAQVLVQGIADLVLVFDDHAEILDYKTDKAADASFYIEEYGTQLRLYRRAFAMRLPVPVTKLTIFSFAMGDEVNIPLEGPIHG